MMPVEPIRFFLAIETNSHLQVDRFGFIPLWLNIELSYDDITSSAPPWHKK